MEDNCDQIRIFFPSLFIQLLDYGRKIAEQDRLLNEYSRKLIQVEQKLNGSEDESVREQTSDSTPPPTNRKRRAEGDNIFGFTDLMYIF